jgi:hypothetical protein
MGGKISSPLVTVQREGHEPLTVQTNNRDLVLWDRTRIKHKWPRFDEAPNLWLTFIAWAAARRTGAIPEDVRYEAWEAEVIDVAGAEDDDDDEDMGRPIRAVADHG